MTKTIPLHFRGFFPLSAIFKPSFKDKLIDTKGIYIWGFLHNKKQFISYYVGKSESNIRNRMKQHYISINFGNTYMIFTPQFYKTLALPQTQNKIKPIPNPSKGFAPHNTDMWYWNNEQFMNHPPKSVTFEKGMTTQGYELYKNRVSGGGFPVSDFISRQFSADNIYVAYCPVSNTTINHLVELNAINANKRLGACMELLEDVTKFALKHHVVSQSNTAPPSTISSLFTITHDPKLKGII